MVQFSCFRVSYRHKCRWHIIPQRDMIVSGLYSLPDSRKRHPPTKRIFLIFASFSVAAISFGAYLYPDKGVFLFPDAPASIGRLELLFHFLWLAIALLILVGITVWSMMTIILHTKTKKVEIMNIDEIRKASRPTILRDKEPVELKEIESE